VVNNACLMSNSMRGGFFASPNKITRAVDDLFLIAAGVQIAAPPPPFLTTFQ
jgi:hypothetical protein